jgi:hydroxyacylglutathione hydrolase
VIFTRFYDDKLAAASYLIGASQSGEAVVVDPTRDPTAYLEAAESEGLRITAVAETHIHADFVSGARELAHRSGARLYLSDEGGPDWRYPYAAADGAVLLRDGSSFMLGEIQLEARHTPGHTPEHMSFLVTDQSVGNSPMGVLTGDFVFVNDVGRPDLLEKVAGATGSAERAARTVFRSLQRFKEAPDYWQIWPAHGAGSACGKSLSAVPQSTVGYERRFNWAFQVTDENEFVKEILASQPEAPRYFAHMKRLNREGPTILGPFRRPIRLEPSRLPTLLSDGAVIIDIRSATDYAAGHVPGTLNLPLNQSFTTWAGWLLPYDRELLLLSGGGSPAELDRAVKDLAMIGLDRVGGCFGPDALDWWARSQGRLETTPQISAAELAAKLGQGAFTVVDVRGASEWKTGHMAGARHIPLGSLPERLGEIPSGGTVVVHCQGGSRSAIGVSLLQTLGRANVVNLPAGLTGWQAAGQPVVRD